MHKTRRAFSPRGNPQSTLTRFLGSWDRGGGAHSAYRFFKFVLLVNLDIDVITLAMSYVASVVMSHNFSHINRHQL